MFTHWIFERMNVASPAELWLVVAASLGAAIASTWIRAAFPASRRSRHRLRAPMRERARRLDISKL